jgi:hypothetical protein
MTHTHSCTRTPCALPRLMSHPYTHTQRIHIAR